MLYSNYSPGLKDRSVCIWLGTDMSEEVSFGNWLRQRRKELSITQEELAERLGISWITLRKLEAGERHPSGQIALLLADYLRVPLDECQAFVAFARTGR